MPPRPQQDLDDYIKREGAHLNEDVVKPIVNTLSHKQEKLHQDYFESIRGLSLASGATASFSLLLLGSDYAQEELYRSLLVLGAIFLLFGAFLSFVHLFRVFTKNSQRLMEQRGILSPIKKVVSASIEYQKGCMSAEKWFQEYEKLKYREYDRLITILDTQSKDEHLDHSDEVLLSFFGIGVSLIITAFASSVFAEPIGGVLFRVFFNP